MALSPQIPPMSYGGPAQGAPGGADPQRNRIAQALMNIQNPQPVSPGLPPPAQPGMPAVAAPPPSTPSGATPSLPGMPAMGGISGAPGGVAPMAGSPLQQAAPGMNPGAGVGATPLSPFMAQPPANRAQY